ncbi:XRE family transcriptional regulator [Halomonas sp. YLB-10]|uniref:helix-turn-helix domain-containing protein n=1 Tax=Halomonas sp. YLB-10 TaxID=2483111 RepID=UPI000F5EF6B3|nr:helix-turn-helix transcriptional regulator [Halomonas sp. YLB-10]RQW70336.1 XRE family transcriptional regulator [Halomonas sp. YLB-10]
MAITALGKLLRQHRIANGEVMKELAEAVGVSSAYLSAVEHGKKAASDKLLSGVASHYHLDESAQEEIKYASELSQPLVSISLSDAEEEERLLAVSFARKFKGLESSEKKQLLKLLNGDQ